jgi:hypothetical protein
MIRAQAIAIPDAVVWFFIRRAAMVYLGMMSLVSGLFIVCGIQVIRFVDTRIDPDLSALNRSAGLDI